MAYNNSTRAKKNTTPAKKNGSDHPKMWSDVEGLMRLYGHERDDGSVRYSTSVSRKNQNNEWENTYYDVQFCGDAPEDAGAFEIRIVRGFLSFNKGKNGVIYPKVVVMEWEY